MGMPSFRTTLGDAFSEGARRLWIIMDKRDLTQADVRRKLGCELGSVNRWLYGVKRPGIESAARIEKVFRIPARLWAEPPHETFELRHASSTGTEG